MTTRPFGDCSPAAGAIHSQIAGTVSIPTSLIVRSVAEKRVIAVLCRVDMSRDSQSLEPETGIPTSESEQAATWGPLLSRLLEVYRGTGRNVSVLP